MPRPPGQPTLTAVDERIYRWFRSALRERERTERLIIAVNRAQHWWPVASLAAALVADTDRRAAWARANAILGGAWTAAKLVSRIVSRPRPNLPDCRPARHKTDHESFPSTHATTAFAAAIALRPLLPRTPLLLLAIATSTNRLLLGEHYPSDVAAGAALGTAVAAPYAAYTAFRPVQRRAR
jgi:membrane-associated phospholipid phosphatase